MSIDSAITSIINNIFSLKLDQTTAFKAFLDKRDLSSVLLTGFHKFNHMLVTCFVALID